MTTEALRYALEVEASRCEREWAQQLMFAERFFGQEARSIQGESPDRPESPSQSVCAESHWDAVTASLQILETKSITLREVVRLTRNLLTGQFLHLSDEGRKSFLRELKSSYETALSRDQSMQDSAPCVSRVRVAQCRGRSDCVKFIDYLLRLC